jgi:hypothetical protein
MDEKYLSELWNWTNSQDPTFKDRYTFDSWSKKLKSNEGYKKQFYGWVSGIDETFEERRPYNAWSEMVSTDKKKEESALFSREGGTLSATPGTGEVGLSGFTRSSRYDEVLPGAVEPPVQREAAQTPVVQTISPKQREEARAEFKPSLSLYSGVERLYGNIAGVIPTIYDFSAELQNDMADVFGADWLRTSYSEDVPGLRDIKNLQGKFYEYADYYKERQRQYDEDITTSISKGNYTDALQQVVSGGLESLPDIALSALSGAGALKAGLAVLGTTQAVNRYEEIKDNENMSGTAKVIDSSLTGMAEAIFESIFGTAQSAKIFKEIIEKEGKEKASAIIKKGINEFYETAAKKYPLLITPIGEGFSELGTQVTQNLIAKHSGADPERDIMEGASDAFILGSAIGGGFGAVNATAKQVASSRVKKEINNSVSKISELNYIINNTPDIPEDVKESLTKLRDKISENVKTSLTNIDSKFSKLSEEQKTEFIGLKRRLNDIGREYESTENETIKKALELEAKEVADKIKRYAVQEQTTSEVPVQPETAVGEEVAEGTPQAESEVAAEEGKEEVAKQYADDLKETKDSDPEQYWSVNSVSEEAAKEGTVITDEDGGVVVSKEGDIKGLFKRTSSKAKGVAQKLLQKAIDAGGKKLDNFDTYLTPIYKKAGFRVVSRIPFNEEYAPDGWNKEKHGTPDVVAMVYDPNNELNIEERTFEDYDEARAYRDSYVEQARAETGQQQTLAAEQGTPTTIEGTGLRENIKKSIAKVFKNFEAKSFKNAKEMTAYAKAKFNEETGATDSARIFVGSDGKVEVLVNEELADDTAFGHEVWHALLLKAFGDNQAKFAEFRGAIDKTLRQNGYEDIADALDEFSSQYTEEGEVPAEEYLAQLGGMMTSANIDLKKLTPAQKSLLQQIKDIINDFAIQLTGQPVFLKEATPETILDFMSTMSDMMAKGEDISQFFGDGTPGSTMTGGVVSRAQIGKDSVDSQFDMSIEYDDSNMPDDLEMPDPQTIEKVLEASGGAAIFINSDGTKVGITRDKKKLQGGWRYAYFKENIDDNIGFAATSETHVGTFYDLMQKVAKERDEANPEMAGKPVAIFVTIQNSESMLGEWYAGEFLMDGLDKAITEKKTTVAKARKLMDVAISETQKRYIESEKKADLKKKNKNSKHKLRTTEEIKKDVAYKQLESLKKIIDEKGFDTHEGRIKAAKELGSKDFSFGFRSSFLKTLIPLKSATGNNKEIKKLLLEVGYGRKDFYKDTMDEVLYDALEKANFDEASIGGSTFGGFYADPSVSKEKFIANKNKGIQHDMFNESFSSNGKTFRLDKPRNVNKLFPSMGFPDSEGYDVYNKANNAKASKASGIIERNNVSKWLLENGYEKNVTNPFTAISGTMYTSTIDSDYQVEEPKVVTRAQKAQPTEATENDFVLPFGKYKGQWYSTTPKNYKEFLLKQDWFDPRKYFAKTLENANESFGTEDGEVNFKSRAQKIDKKKTKELSSSIINNFNDEELESAKSLINKVEPPNKTTKAYKLFKVKKEFPGELFPLFVGANESVTVGEWIEAKAGELTQTKEGKTMVKSTLGPLAYRPGWHSGDIAVATHIGSKKKSSDKAPTLRADDQVWAEVEVGNDFDWQAEANNRASKTKDGKVVPRTAHITDQVPSKGFYKYKTNSNMTGSWIISGEMKVNRVLTEKEVEEINKKSNAKDLPRLTPFDYEAYGFDKNGSVKNTKQVIANQIARAYQVAKENGENAELVSFVEKKAITRAQKAQPQTIPGYDRMIGEAKSIVEKSKKRGVSADQIVENVINYIQKSRVYERADDLQREQIIRDARKDLGLRQKSAPSVDKLLGKIKDIKKVTVTEKSALKELLKAEAKGARTAVQARSQAAKALNDMLKALEKKGSVTTAQVRAIMTRYSKVNFFSSSSMDNFVNYMAKVFSDAEYSDKLKTASKTANAIRRLSKSDSVQAGTKAVAKKFLEIDPRLVEDIDKYLEFAKALNDAVRTSMAINVDGDFEVLLKKAIDYNEFQDYMDAQIAAQEEYIKNQLAEIHKDLVDSGAIDASMSLADMKAIIDAINYENEDSLPSEEKERMIRAYLGSVMDSYAGLMDYMLENSMDPFSLELISISDKDRQTVSKFMKMDLNKLSLKEAYSVVEAIENFIVNKNVDNMGAVLAGYEGDIDAESMQRKGTKSRPIRSFFSKKFGRVWAEQIEQLQITMERMFGGIEKATEIMRRSGVLDISQGKTKAVMQSEKIINKYTEKFGKIKDFNSAENIFERKIISFMTRTINSSDIQKSIEFERRKKIIDETITAMENGSETEVRDAAIARDIYDKALKDAKTPQDVASKSKDFNNQAVKFWIDEFSNIFDELQSVSRSVYNTILERDVNYTPDRFKRFEGIEEVIDITGSSFAANNESYDTKKSGTLMANNRIKTLGKDPKRVLSFDFDTDMSNAMMNALIDINTAYAIRKAKSFYESDSFGKMVPSKDDRELIRRRIKAFITKTKRKEYVPQSELAQSMKAVNLMSQIAVGRALGSLAQVPKQTISVMANTMINSDGKLSFIDVINAKEFIDNSGYSIALRGIASNADVQTINKMLERQSESTAQEIQRGLNKAAEMWLNSFIAKPDVWAARLSWITYYKESLRKQGIDADNIDWSTHEINQKAGDYAQAQVNRQQNYSDSDFAGELLGSKDPMKAYIRKVLFPYMTFVFNQKSRQMADIAILSNKTSSKADKSKARRSLYGLGAEMATYSLVGYFIKEVYAFVVNALTGGDDEEKDKDKRLKNHIKYSTKTMINDLLSPIPNITDTPIDLAINKIMKISGLDEDVFSIPEDKGKSLAEVAVGPSSIMLEGMVNLERMSYAALTGTAVGEYMGKPYERELSKENQDLMKYVTVVYTAYLVGAVPADMGRLSEQVYRKLLKDSKKKKGGGSGGIKTSIDTKIK